VIRRNGWHFGSARLPTSALAIGMIFTMSHSGCTTVPTAPSSAVDALFAETTSSATPGAAIIVIQDGKVLQKSAYGMADLERGVPFEIDTSTRLASVSKQFTAMAIMMLEEEGRLGYDDPITRFLPEISRVGDAITIRNLLNHTGGTRSGASRCLRPGSATSTAIRATNCWP